jgi:ATP-dependent exoDNAse (exonuclease V) beta subunit
MNPNSEQLLAIESDEGTLLGAGAGAGKTFVIVEHFFKFIDRRFEGNWERVLKKELEVEKVLRSMVVITFTVKASEELFERLKKRSLSYAEQKPWGIFVKEKIECVFIGTIHSLCYSILSERNIKETSLFEVVDSFIIESKLRKILKAFFEQSTERSDIRYFNLLEKSILEVYSDPLKRVFWEENLSPEKKQDEFYNFLSMYDFSRFELVELEKKLKWLDLYNQFTLVAQENLHHKSKEKFSAIFQDFKRMPPLKEGSVDDGVYQNYQVIKAFKKDFLDLLENEKHNSENIESKNKVQELLVRALLFIGKYYFDDLKISFSDLEYLFLKFRKSMKLDFKKVIIDEYQDVSLAQKNIFEVLCSGDLSRLFCVGDPKQSIYSFRGSEVEVFNDAKKELNFLELKSNYRSYQKIVNFNNEFFANVLSEKSLQNPELSYEGLVQFVHTEENDETQAILSEILIDIESTEIQSIAVLYKFMRPAFSVIDGLMAQNISFETRLKVEHSEEPIFSIFSFLIDFLSEKRDFTLTFEFIKSYLIYLDDSSEIPSENCLVVFKNSYQRVGLYNSFTGFLSDIGLYISYSDVVLSKISMLCRNYIEDIKEIYHGLKKIKLDQIQIDFHGNSEKTISIISVHSSKGLEYDSVILGGLCSNNRGRNDRKTIGKNRDYFSFLNQKDEVIQATPLYVQGLVDKIKEQEESLRLLYVACTRAIKKLSFILEKKEKVSEKSWGGIILNNLPTSSLYQSKDYEALSREKKSLEIPFLKRTDLGLSANTYTQKSFFLPELSVTKLSIVGECPRKFYFQEILKIEQSSLEDFGVEAKIKVDESSISSDERGTQIHSEISEMITKKVTPPKGNKILEYIFNLLKDYTDWKLISEQPIKFEILNYMVNGTIDLVLEKNTECELWDYKTGKFKNDQQYHSQIILYGHALTKKNNLIQELTTKIIYVDEQKIVEKIYTKEELEIQALAILDKTQMFDQKNLAFCSECTFQNICEK